MPPGALLSIGYGARPLQEMAGLWRLHEVAWVVDVRSRPYSKNRPEWRKKSLETALPDLGFHYAWMGDQLGGMPDDPRLLGPDGRPDRDAIAASPDFRQGLTRLLRARDKGLRLCLMCAEAKPEECHRARLIGRELALLKVPLLHIDERGQLISQEDAMARLVPAQGDLFGNL
jgi:ATP-dependent DNA helicase RecQ